MVGLPVQSRYDVARASTAYGGVLVKKGSHPKIENFVSRLPYYLPPLRIFSSHNYAPIRDICL